MPLSDDVLRVGGRRVGYRLSGADTRPTLLYLHGAPSSRAEVGDYEPGLLEERGICAVAVDRPGYGATDPLKDLDLLARTRDAVAVAGHLGMAGFAVQGTSGGGPYSLACAVLMPDQVQAVVLTSAGGCLSEEGGLDGMPADTAEGWRRTWRDPEGARARLEVAVRADPPMSVNGSRGTARHWPGTWRRRHGRGRSAGGSMVRPSVSCGRLTSRRSGRRSTSFTVTATAWRPCRSSGEASPGQHA